MFSEAVKETGIVLVSPAKIVSVTEAGDQFMVGTAGAKDGASTVGTAGAKDGANKIERKLNRVAPVMKTTQVKTGFFILVGIFSL